MEIVGLEPRRSDLARGIVIARSARAARLPTAQRALWEALAAAGVTEPSEADDDDDEPERQWLAAPWLPPAADELDEPARRARAVASDFGLEAIWCVKVETGIDGVAWLELAAAEPAAGRRRTSSRRRSARSSTRSSSRQAEVLYAAPDAPAEPAADETTRRRRG